MRRILIVMGRYLPGYKDGGPVRSIKNLIDRLGDEYDFHILTTDRDHGDECSYPNIKVRGWNQIDKAKVFYVEPGGFDTQTVLKCAENMDLVYVCGCFNDYARTVLGLKKRGKINCNVIVASMGLFSPGAFRIKFLKKKTYTMLLRWLGYFKNIEWSATDESEANDIRKQIGENAICHLAEDLPRKSESVKHQTFSDKNCLRIVFLSRISRKKNLLFTIKILQEMESDIVFDIYGNKEDSDYWQECEQELKKLPNNVKWSYQGVAESEKVVAVFSKYDVFLFPTMAENYGHVIFEAMTGGCIPIISDQTPWTNEKMGNCGKCIALDNEHALQCFRDALDKYCAMTREEKQRIADVCISYASGYCVEEAENQYRRILNG